MINRDFVESRGASRALEPGARRPRTHRFGNYLKTAILLAGLTALALVIGEQLGGPRGLVLAGFFVAIMNFVSWWFSDRIALAVHGAHPLDVERAPWLFDMVQRLAQRAGLPMPKLYVIDIPTPNAFATGRSPSKAALAVTTGLLELMDRRELEGVLAHELAHVQNRDTLISTVAATLAGVITWAVQSIFWFGGAFLGRGDDDREGGVGNALASLGLLLVAPIAATLLQLAVSRSREYGADASGAALTGDPDGLADALLKLQSGVEHFPYDRAPATA
ncbi:MAG TPA: zinc metalloprotease HtpX, partial [Myxococcaceae bacterium]|nr:zinc metalloprotease HtpX [Myxococcaceae bacterium]